MGSEVEDPMGEVCISRLGFFVVEVGGGGRERPVDGKPGTRRMTSLACSATVQAWRWRLGYDGEDNVTNMLIRSDGDIQRQTLPG